MVSVGATGILERVREKCRDNQQEHGGVGRPENEERGSLFQVVRG
jgi:hypothetical protein